MDQAGQVGGVLGIVLTVVGIIYGAINHKRFRSNCCGRKLEVSIDVENTAKIKPVPSVDEIHKASPK